MISRARYIIEEIKDEFMEYKYCFNDNGKLEKLKRFCETNFDMKDIVFSSDKAVEINFIENAREDFLALSSEQDDNNIKETSSNIHEIIEIMLLFIMAIHIDYLYILEKNLMINYGSVTKKFQKMLYLL